MIRRFRSFIVALALLVSFTVYDTRNASAIVDPFTAYVVASAVIHAVIIGGAYVGYKYYKKENGGSRDANGTKVTPNGTIGRDATVTWVDISTGVPEIKSKNVTAKISYDKLKSAVTSNSSKYPKLSASLKSIPTTGDVVTIGGTNYLLGSQDSQTYDSRNYDFMSYGQAFINTGATPPDRTDLFLHKIYFVTVTSSPVSSSTVSAPDFAKKLSNSTSPITVPQNVYSDYYQEIDDYITDNPNVMEYVDTEDSSQVDNAPVSPAPSVPSSSQYQAAVDTKAAIESAQKAATSAQTAADAAAQKYQQSGTPEDYQKMLDAQAAADKAKADADALASDKSADAAEKDGSSYYSAQNPAYGDGEETDFGSRLDTFFTDLKGTSLFSLPDRLLSGLPSGGSPVCTVNAGRWGVHQIDFSTQSTSLNLIKTIMLIGFTFAGIRILVLKGGSG